MSDATSQSARRAAVYLALREHLEGDALWQALYLWQCDFADKPRFAIAGFVRAVASQYGVRGGALHRALTRNSLTDLNGSAVDPIEELRAFVAFNGLALPDNVEVEEAGVSPPAEIDAPEFLSPTFESIHDRTRGPGESPFETVPSEAAPHAAPDTVFARLTDAMRSMCRETTAGDAAFLAALSAADMDTVDRALVERWWLEGHWRETAGLDLADQRQVVNALYRTLCELVGPVVADRHFGRALDLAQSSASDAATLRQLL